MKASSAALLGVFLLIVAIGCGETSKTGGASSKARTAADRGARTEGVNAPASGPHAFGDYDSDEYVARAIGGDADSDDNMKRRDRDNDLDNRGGTYFDVDDKISLDFGHPAGAADRRAITELVKRYYVLAAADDGAGACALLSAPIATSIPQTIGTGGPWYFRGRTCAEIMTKIFAKNVYQLAAYAASIRVVTVGVDHDEAVTVFAVKGHPGRGTRALREHGIWRMNALVDFELI
jgi:ketosteroid isomerase-like protein